MNIKSMRLRSYRSFAVDEHVPPEAAERYRTPKAYERLRVAAWRRSPPVRAVCAVDHGSRRTSKR